MFINCRFLTQEITGVQRYAIELSRRLKKIDSAIRFVAPPNVIHQDIAHELEAEIVGRRTGHAWEQIDLPLFMKREGHPLLVNLCNAAPIFYRNKITTIHDIAFLKSPESFSWKFRTLYRLLIPTILQTSKRILTVSDFTRREICTAYPIDFEKIDVIYNAASSFESTAVENNRDRPYILAVSSLNARKNLHGLIKAFSLIQSKSSHLYIAGGFNRSFSDKALNSLVSANPRIHFLGRVSDAELAKLYHNAAVFVFPSFYEGFGIPLLEAQLYGCPVICSDASSFPEVCGDSALYFSPDDPVDIASKIDLLLDNPELASKLVAAGFINNQRFNWDKSAQDLYCLLRKHSARAPTFSGKAT